MDKTKVQKEMDKLRSTYGLEGSGYIVRKSPKTGKEDKLIAVDCAFIPKNRGSVGVDPHNSGDNLPLITTLAGVLYRGRFLSDSFKEEHYTKFGVDKSIGQCLCGDEKMKLTLKDGSEIILTRLWFGDPLNSGENSGRIENKEFRADLYEA